MEHLERLKKLCFQLTVLLDLDVFTIQPNFLVEDITPRLDPIILSLFLKFLGMVEVFLANNYQLS